MSRAVEQQGFVTARPGSQPVRAATWAESAAWASGVGLVPALYRHNVVTAKTELGLNDNGQALAVGAVATFGKLGLPITALTPHTDGHSGHPTMVADHPVTLDLP